MNKIMENSRDRTYSIPPSTADQLLLLPGDSACFTPNTTSVSSALSLDINNYDGDNIGRLFTSIPGIGVIKRKDNTRSDQAINKAYTNEGMT